MRPRSISVQVERRAGELRRRPEPVARSGVVVPGQLHVLVGVLAAVGDGFVLHGARCSAGAGWGEL